MQNYKENSLWKRTLGIQKGNDSDKSQRNLLKTEYENFREKVLLLAGEISRNLPDFTNHDIKHIDALWDTADLIVPDDLDLNPAEAFVLGGAFLIHDLGMTLASYPYGLKELKEQQIWKDTAAKLMKEEQGSLYSIDTSKISDKIETRATEITLRDLHAKRAKELATMSWKDPQGKDVFLMDNQELRETYGAIIGKIAYSHWIKVENLEDNLQPLQGACSDFPNKWTVDSFKLACILRLADAMQIDDRRAKSFLRTVRRPSAGSDLYWCFQEKMLQPRLEKKRIVYTSKSPFKLNEAEAWWIGYDTLKMVDNELRNVDAAMTLKYGRGFNAIGVSRIEDINKLSELMTVEGWQPIDTSIKVNNVAKLVSNIGGRQLYGNNSTVPLRELIQNAADAIRARRILDGENIDYGNILIRINEDTSGTYIEVEDNGIGMSKDVLTGPFLDFGQSFWGTELMHKEWPGLESKGFNSTGRYGIGFFSLFMWSNNIKVITRRFTEARNETTVLEFKNGVTSRPILRNATEAEVLRNGGTCVRVYTKEKMLSEMLNTYKDKKETFAELIESLCIAMDCDIYVEQKGKLKLIIKANDWISITPNKLVKRILGKKEYNTAITEYKDYFNIILKNIKIIKNEHEQVVGRAAVAPIMVHENIFDGIVTVGGFKTTKLRGIFGILVGNSERASRDIGMPVLSNICLFNWCSEQIDLLNSVPISDSFEVNLSEALRALCGKTGSLKIARTKKGLVSYNEIKNESIGRIDTDYIIIQDAAIDVYEKENSCKIDLNDNVYSAAVGRPGILQTAIYQGSYFSWPILFHKSAFSFHKGTLKGAVIEAISEAWNYSPEEVYLASDISSDSKHYNAIIGTVDGKPVKFDNVAIIKSPKLKSKKHS